MKLLLPPSHAAHWRDLLFLCCFAAWLGAAGHAWSDMQPARPAFLIIDLSPGPETERYPVSDLDEAPEEGWPEEFRSTHLVLRRIPTGSFLMGSPEDELGRRAHERQREVMLRSDFYMGIFEVTQKQWERVMGDWPSYFTNALYRETRPVEQVSWHDIRGRVDDAGLLFGTWPQSMAVAPASFMGRLRARTGLDGLDLPTEAQWEFACRAGSTHALNTGFDLEDMQRDDNLAAAGRYWYNGGSAWSIAGSPETGTAEVGSYLPNAWGLYDMHGNIAEWCLDWYEPWPKATVDPPGAITASSRVLRGGSWFHGARYCRSAHRDYYFPSHRGFSIGFRVALNLPAPDDSAE